MANYVQRVVRWILGFVHAPIMAEEEQEQREQLGQGHGTDTDTRTNDIVRPFRTSGRSHPQAIPGALPASRAVNDEGMAVHGELDSEAAERQNRFRRNRSTEAGGARPVNRRQMTSDDPRLDAQQNGDASAFAAAAAASAAADNRDRVGSASQQPGQWYGVDRHGQAFPQTAEESEQPLTPRRRRRAQQRYAEHHRRVQQDPDLSEIEIPPEEEGAIAEYSVVGRTQRFKYKLRGGGGGDDDPDDEGSAPGSAAGATHNALDCSSCPRRRIRRQRPPLYVFSEGDAPLSGVRELVDEVFRAALAPFEVLVVVFVMLLLVAGYLVVLAMLAFLTSRVLSGR